MRRRTKYKGVRNDLGKIIRDIDTKPLNQRIKCKRIKPDQKSDATEQLLFDNSLPGLDDDLASMMPDYVRKYQKLKSQ